MSNDMFFVSRNDGKVKKCLEVSFDDKYEDVPLVIHTHENHLIINGEFKHSVVLSVSEAIELSNFLLDVLHVNKDQRYLDKVKETLE